MAKMNFFFYLLSIYKDITKKPKHMKTQSYYIPNELLTTRNKKLVKGEKFGYKTYGLSLSPYNQNSQGKNICPMASLGCASACLFGAGHGSMSNVIKGRTNKTEFFLANRQGFLNMLFIEIAQLELKHKLEKTKFAIRLNVTSDISWENFKLEATGKNIFESFPNVIFYDYTKNYLRFKKELPKNYSLTFSRSETNDKIAMELLKTGINVAMVFDKIPTEYKGYKVIDGDISDTRFLDDKGIIVGLKYKKLTGKGVDNNEAFKSGFAIKLKSPSFNVPVKLAA